MSAPPEYAELEVPAETPPAEYTWVERRTELYSLIEEAGHPRNLRRNQSELAARYDVSQQMISKDFQKLREYQRNRAGTRAISTTRWLHERVVQEELDRGNLMNALHAQMEYNDFLFELGRLESAPDELHVTGDAGEMYMEMLRQQAGSNGADSEAKSTVRSVD